MKKIITLILLMLCTIQVKSQWVSNYSGNSGGDLNLNNADGNVVTVDNNGNSYVAGYVFNVGTDKDILLIKYSPAGDTLWTRTYNGTENLDDEAYGIAVDNSGNIYICGDARMTGKYYETILLKYNSSGTLQWAKTWGASAGYNSDKAVAIALDGSCNIYLTGYVTELDLRHDIVTIKYDPNGNRKWTKQEDGLDNLDAEGTSIAVDHQGNIVVTGFCTSIAGGKDIVVLKYKNDGVGGSLWMRSYNGSSNGEDKAWGIVVDAGDNIYVTGYKTMSGSNTDGVTLKYDPSGNNIWTRSYNGTGNSSDKAWGIVVDTDGSVYITGETTDATSNVNYFTAKYDNYGNQSWVSCYNGTGNGTDAACSIGIFTDANNVKDVVVTGKSWGMQLNYDYATVKYTAQTGTQTQAIRYSLNGISNDYAEDICVSDALNKVYVTGCSELIIESNNGGSYVSTMMLDWGNSSELTTENVTPKTYTLHQNYPNPFNPSTAIKFDINTASRVKLTVYDMLGKVMDVLVDQDLAAGSYNITYTNKSLASGIYFYELSADNFRDVKKM